MAESKLDEILRTRKCPGIAGCSTGPGSGSNELVFDRPDPAKDIPLTLRKMEEAGQLKDPAAMQAAMIKMRAAKTKQYKRVDYGKEGHPIEKDTPIAGIAD